MALLTYEQFIKKYNGKQIDYDGIAGCQCVDLAKYYLDEVFGIKCGAWGDAHSWYDEWTIYTNQLQKNFVRIANTPDFVPQKGDIAVWKPTLSAGGWGHIAICTGEGNTSYFYSYDCNWTGNHDACTKIKHNYSNFYGVLRPKDQSRINPTTNSDTVKKGDTKMVIDVSTYQPNVNYATLAKEVDGIIIRVGYRGYGSAGTLVKDNMFDKHITGAINNKIPYGFYFMSQAVNAAEGKAEADFVYSIIKSYKPTYPIYFDSEYSGAPNNTGRADKISKTARTNAAVAFCDRIKELGLLAGVYAGQYWLNDNLDYSKVRAYSIWCPKYGTDNGTAQNAYKPDLPEYDGWQFTSKYKVAAISSGVDMSYFYKDFSTKASTPTETTTPTTPTVTYKTYYVNDKAGVNYRATPNGILKGTYKYGTAVKVVVGSETKAGNYTWVKIENGCYMAKSLLSTTKPTVLKSVDEIAKEVIAGKWDVGDARKKKLTTAGYDYNAVQKRVNEILNASKKSVETIAKEVIAGKWGNGTDRVKRLAAAGYNYNTIQRKVNELLKK